MEKAYGVSLLIINGNKILGVARRNDPNDWALPGGKVDADESEEDAAIRECLEETGLKISNLKEVYRGIVQDHIGVTFVCDWTGTPSTQENEPECKWVSKEELVNGCFGKYNSQLFEKLGI